MNSTYSGDNYPKTACDVGEALPPISFAISMLAGALDAQDDIVKRLRARLSAVTIPPYATEGGEAKGPSEIRSAIRSNIDAQSTRIRVTNAALNELLERLEI